MVELGNEVLSSIFYPFSLNFCIITFGAEVFLH